MTLVSSKPRPCADPNCRRQHAPAERDALAMSLFSARQASVGLEDQRLEDLIAENAALIGFRPTQHVIEVEGVCATCIVAGAA